MPIGSNMSLSASGEDESLKIVDVFFRMAPGSPLKHRSSLGRGKGTSLNSTCLTPKPLASSVYVHVPEALSLRKRAISVMSLFPLFLDGQSIVVMERGGWGSADHFPTEAESDVGHVPSSSRRNRVLALERLPLQCGEIDPVEYWGSSGIWLWDRSGIQQQ